MGPQNFQHFTFMLFLTATMFPFCNSIMIVVSINSQVEQNGNTDCNIKVQNTEGKILRNSNCDVDWSDSNVNIESNSNIYVQNNGGEKPKDRSPGLCEFLENSNFCFAGSGQVDCRFERNSNADVSIMQGGKITAKENSNLKIAGNSHDLIVSGVTNHLITSVNENQGNRFEVVNQEQRNQEQGWLDWILGRYKAVFATQPGHLRFELDYFGKAVIDKDTYSVACFNWKITPQGDGIKIEVNHGQTDLELKQVGGPNSVVISCMENGKRRDLTLRIDNGLSTSLIHLGLIRFASDKQTENTVSSPLGFKSEL